MSGQLMRMSFGAGSAAASVPSRGAEAGSGYAGSYS